MKVYLKNKLTSLNLILFDLLLVSKYCKADLVILYLVDEQTTTEPFLDATGIFFPDGKPVGQKNYDFEIMSRNHELTSDPTSSIVDFNLPEDRECN